MEEIHSDVNNITTREMMVYKTITKGKYRQKYNKEVDTVIITENVIIINDEVGYAVIDGEIKEL